MSNPRRSDKTSSQEWPYICFSERENKWKVDSRTKEGGSRRFFTTKIEAQTFAQQCRIHRGEHGTAAFGNAELAQHGKTVRDAIDFYLAHLRQQERSIPVAEAVVELVAIRKAAGKSQRYCRDLELRLGRFERDFPARSVASFTAKELDEWLASLSVAPGTRNTFRRDLRTFFSFCEKRGYCAGNEAKKTERARDVDKPAGILTVAQTGALLGACGDDTLPVVAVSHFAGLRSAEVQKLDWSEIDLDGGHVEVTAAKSKTARRRLVPISENLAALLRRLAQTAGPVAPVWPPQTLRRREGPRRAQGLASECDAAQLRLLSTGRLPRCRPRRF